MVAATLTVWLVAQACINIGYVVGLLPVTGIPLPLVSSGGTSLVLALLCSASCSRTSPGTSPRRRAALRAHGPGASRAGPCGCPSPSLPRAAATDRPARRDGPGEGAGERARGGPGRGRA